MVCSLHFVDGEPTFDSPCPTLNMGYLKPTKKPQRHISHQELTVVKDSTVAMVGQASSSSDHLYCKNEDAACMACNDKNQVLKSMADEITSLNKQKEVLEEDIIRLSEDVKQLKIAMNSRKAFSTRTIKSDAKMRFYTGIQTIAMFNVMFSLIKPYVQKLVFWRGSKVTTSIATKRDRNKTHNLCLLVLMRLRLGLLNQDLADRFQISESICSNRFATWVRFCPVFWVMR